MRKLIIGSSLLVIAIFAMLLAAADETPQGDPLAMKPVIQTQIAKHD